MLDIVVKDPPSFDKLVALTKELVLIQDSIRKVLRSVDEIRKQEHENLPASGVLFSHMLELKELAFPRQGQKMKEINGTLSKAIDRVDEILRVASSDLYEKESNSTRKPENDPRNFKEELFINIRSRPGFSDFHYHSAHLLLAQKRIIFLLNLLESMSCQGVRTWEEWDRVLDILVALRMEILEHLGYHMGHLRAPLKQLLESLRPAPSPQE